MIPADLKDEKDEAAVARARAEWERAGNPQLMTLLVAAMDSEAEIFKDEKGEWDCKGNMSECPIVVATRKAGFELAALHKQYPKVLANPFNSARKMSSTIRSTANGDPHYFHGVSNIAAVKGAPDRLLAKCNRIAVEGAVPGTFTVKAMTPEDLAGINAG
jgi:magnesium-transporting ATPase (P-type)